MNVHTTSQDLLDDDRWVEESSPAASRARLCALSTTEAEHAPLAVHARRRPGALSVRASLISYASLRSGRKKTISFRSLIIGFIPGPGLGSVEASEHLLGCLRVAHASPGEMRWLRQARYQLRFVCAA